MKIKLPKKPVTPYQPLMSDEEDEKYRREREIAAQRRATAQRAKEWSDKNGSRLWSGSDEWWARERAYGEAQREKKRQLSSLAPTLGGQQKQLRRELSGSLVKLPDPLVTQFGIKQYDKQQKHEKEKNDYIQSVYDSAGMRESERVAGDDSPYLPKAYSNDQRRAAIGNKKVELDKDYQYLLDVQKTRAMRRAVSEDNPYKDLSSDEILERMEAYRREKRLLDEERERLDADTARVQEEIDREDYEKGGSDYVDSVLRAANIIEPERLPGDDNPQLSKGASYTEKKAALEAEKKRLESGQGEADADYQYLLDAHRARSMHQEAAEDNPYRNLSLAELSARLEAAREERTLLSGERERQGAHNIRMLDYALRKLKAEKPAEADIDPRDYIWMPEAKDITDDEVARGKADFESSYNDYARKAGSGFLWPGFLDEHMSKEEQRAFYAMWDHWAERGDEETLLEVGKRVYTMLSGRMQEKLISEGEQKMAEGGADGAAATVITGLLRTGLALEAPVAYAGDMLNNTAYNAAHGTDYAVPKLTTGTNAMVAKNRSTEALLSQVPDELRPAAELGLSIADNAMNTLIFRQWSPAVMALQAGTDTAHDVAERGGTGSQQWALGGAAAASEFFFERVSFKGLTNLATDRSLTKSFAKNLLSQSAIEAKEEMATEAANIAADLVIMRDKSDVAQYCMEYMAQHPDAEAAEIALNTAFQVIGRIGEAGIGGFVSGGVMGSGAQIYGNVRNGLTAFYTAAGARNAESAVDSAYRTIAGQGLWSDESRKRSAEAAHLARTQGEVSSRAAQKVYGARDTEGNFFMLPVFQDGKVVEDYWENSAGETEKQDAQDAGALSANASNGAARGKTKSFQYPPVFDSTGKELYRVTPEMVVENGELAQKVSKENALIEGLPESATEEDIFEGLRRMNPDADEEALRNRAAYLDASRKLAGGVELSKLNSQKSLALAAAIEKSTGLAVRFGDVTESGAVVKGEGLYDRGTGTIWINPRLATKEDVVRAVAVHELVHSLETMPEYDALQRSLFDWAFRGDEGKLSEAVRKKTERYRGAGETLNEEQAKKELTSELAARYFGTEAGVNTFVLKNPGLAGRVYAAVKRAADQLRGFVTAEKGHRVETLQELRRVQQMQKRFAKALRQFHQSQKGGGEGVQHRIEYDQNNRPFVVVEEDILNGVPEEDWIKTVKENLKQKFPNGVEISGRQIKINAKSQNEITRSKYSKRIAKKNPQRYADKFRATNNADEILQASRGYVGEALKHDRDDNIREFARGTVQMEIGGREYMADVVVGTTTGNHMLLYDIVKLKPTTIQKKQHSPKQVVTSDGTRQVGTNAASPAPTVSHEGKEVKSSETQNSGNVQHSLDMFPGDVDARKEAQLRVILQSNPAGDDYHTWIRGVEDIRTFEETLSDPDWDYDEFDPDYTREMAEAAVKNGRITVYSSYPISAGVFVTPSAMEAESYAADGRIYSKSVPVDDVAWIDPTQGQYAPTDMRNGVSHELDAQPGIQWDAKRFTEEYRAENEANLDNLLKLSEASRKAQNYARRAKSGALSRLASEFGLDRRTEKAIGPLLDRARAEIDRDGTISGETREAVMGIVQENAVERDSTFFDEYRGLKEELRGTRLAITDSLRGGFQNWNEFRRGAAGTVTLVREGGIPVDTKYKELSQDYPELFPDDITHPADQLQRMLEVGKKIAPSERAMFDGMAPEGVRDARSEIGRILSEYQEKVERSIAYDAEQRARTDYLRAETFSEEEVEKYVNEGNSLRAQERKYEAAVRDSLLMEEEMTLAQEIRRGTRTADSIKSWMARDEILRIAEAGAALDAAKAPYEEFRRRKRESRDADAERLIEHSDGWKDKRNGKFYSTETQERNIIDIAGKEDGERIIRAIFDPIHKNEAESARMANRYRDRVKELDLSKKESFWVQKVGEGDMALSDVPGSSREKVKHAVSEFRAIYDELLDMANRALIENGYLPVPKRKNYFPHFNKPGDPVSKALSAMGISIETSMLPTDIAGLTYTFKPGKKYFGNFNQRYGKNTTFDAVEGFDRYIDGIRDVIFHTDDIQRLRAFDRALRKKYSETEVQKKVDEIKRDRSLTEEQRREEINRALYGEDGSRKTQSLSNYVQNLTAYTNLLAGKKSFADRNMEQEWGRITYDIAAAVERNVAANMVAVNPGSWLTNFIPITQAASAVKNKNLLRGMWETVHSIWADDGFQNRSTFLTNRAGSDRLRMGVQGRASDIAGKPMEWIDRFTSQSIVRAKYYDLLERGYDAETALTRADRFAAGVIGDRSKGAMPTQFYVKNPLSKALTMFQLEVNNQYRYLFKDLPRDIKADHEKWLGALIWGWIKYFVGAYLFNDVYEAVVGRRPALDPIGTVNDVIGKFKGYKASNVVDIGGKLISGQGFQPLEQTEQKEGGELFFSTAKEIGGNLPFVGGWLDGGRIPISSAMPDFERLFTMDGDTASNKKFETWLREGVKPVMYLLPTFGMGQVAKSAEGIATVNAGGGFSLDKKGRRKLQFPVEQTAGNYIKAGLFGKYALPGAQEYVDSGFQTLSAEKTAGALRLRETGVPLSKFLEIDRELSDEEKYKDDIGKDGFKIEKSGSIKKRKYIDSLGLDTRQRKILYDTMGVAKEVAQAPHIAIAGLSPAAQEDATIANMQGRVGYKKFAEVYQGWTAIADRAEKEKWEDGEENKKKRQYLYDDQGLTSEQKALIDNLLINDEKEVSYESEGAFRLSQRGKTDFAKGEALSAVSGLDLNLYADYLEGIKGKRKNAEKYAVIDSLPLKPNQRELLKALVSTSKASKSKVRYYIEMAPITRAQKDEFLELFLG